MANDIFNRSVEYGGAFSADGVRLTFDTWTGAGFMVQQMGVSYRTQTNRVYELGSTRQYMIAGRSSGNGSIARLVGPKPFALDFYQKFGDVCKLPTNHLNISLGSSGCGLAGDLQSALESDTGLTCHHCFVEALEVGVNAGDALFNERSQFQFFALEGTTGT